MARRSYLLGFVLCGGLAACGYPPLDPVVAAGQDAGSSGDDGSTATVADHLMFSTGNVTLAQGQQVRLRVQRVHEDGSMTDVTAEATYLADNEAVVAISDAAVVTSIQAGTAVVTARFAGAAQASIAVTVTNVLCHPVINELVTGTATGGSSDEFVELYNPCVSAFDVDGWTLDYRSSTSSAGNPDTNLLATLTGNLAAGGYLLAAGTGYTGPADWTFSVGTGLGQAGGAVGLRDGAMTTGALIDSVGYGIVTAGNPFIESSPIPDIPTGLSASRLPFDGNDNNNNSEDIQIVATPTPGKPNAP
ncbi:MAG TPA: lamin tail domain-containing protein [Kofleriaceae bacterium]|jgi:hypothetical protein|nr:lamin tail domain-containing protein [Kofleriaceae bacterium]